jgi:hypothetical protein
LSRTKKSFGTKKREIRTSNDFPVLKMRAKNYFESFTVAFDLVKVVVYVVVAV